MPIRKKFVCRKFGAIRYRDTIYVAAWVVTLHTVLTGQTNHVKINNSCDECNCQLRKSFFAVYLYVYKEANRQTKGVI